MLAVGLVIAGIALLIVVGSVSGHLRMKRIVAVHRMSAVSEPSDEVTQQVKRIVAENRAMNPTDIFVDMTLESDLGITGDDASDLFQDFIKSFPDVDWSGLNLHRYFYPEGWTFGAEKVYPLRVADVVQAVRDRRWQVETKLAWQRNKKSE